MRSRVRENPVTDLEAPQAMLGLFLSQDLTHARRSRERSQSVCLSDFLCVCALCVFLIARCEGMVDGGKKDAGKGCHVIHLFVTSVPNCFQINLSPVLRTDFYYRVLFSLAVIVRLLGEEYKNAGRCSALGGSVCHPELLDVTPDRFQVVGIWWRSQDTKLPSPPPVAYLAFFERILDLQHFA